MFACSQSWHIFKFSDLLSKTSRAIAPGDPSWLSLSSLLILLPSILLCFGWWGETRLWDSKGGKAEWKTTRLAFTISIYLFPAVLMILMLHLISLSHLPVHYSSGIDVELSHSFSLPPHIYFTAAFSPFRIYFKHRNFSLSHQTLIQSRTSSFLQSPPTYWKSYPSKYKCSFSSLVLQELLP